MRWNGNPVCPFCNSGKPYVTNRGYKCSSKDCRKKFTVKVGTIFENSKIPFRTWFAAIYLVTAHKKGVSSLQFHRDLGVTQKTAWFMAHRIRLMFKETAPARMENGIVEADETYIGGKEKNKHANKKSRDTEGNYVDIKAPVFGMVQRDGNVFAKKLQGADKFSVTPIIKERVSQEATIVTDESQIYRYLGEFYDHTVINHSQGIYVAGKAHTNTIEGFFSLFKRGIIGIYHQVSVKHLNQYCNEFSFRYNTRKVTDPVRFLSTLPLANKDRVRYKVLTSKWYEKIDYIRGMSKVKIAHGAEQQGFLVRGW